MARGTADPVFEALGLQNQAMQMPPFLMQPATLPDQVAAMAASAACAAFADACFNIYSEQCQVEGPVPDFTGPAYAPAWYANVLAVATAAATAAAARVFQPQVPPDALMLPDVLPGVSAQMAAVAASCAGIHPGQMVLPGHVPMWDAAQPVWPPVLKNETELPTTGEATTKASPATKEGQDSSAPSPAASHDDVPTTPKRATGLRKIELGALLGLPDLPGTGAELTPPKLAAPELAGMPIRLKLSDIVGREEPQVSGMEDDSTWWSTSPALRILSSPEATTCDSGSSPEHELCNSNPGAMLLRLLREGPGLDEEMGENLHEEEEKQEDAPKRRRRRGGRGRGGAGAAAAAAAEAAANANAIAAAEIKAALQSGRRAKNGEKRGDVTHAAV